MSPDKPAECDTEHCHREPKVQKIEGTHGESFHETWLCEKCNGSDWRRNTLNKAVKIA